MIDFEARLREIDEKGLTRELFTMPASGGKFSLNGKEYLNFSSNDYLDLANDDRIKKASIAAVEKYGAGSGGSRLMCGTLPLHEELEASLAGWLGYEAGIVFGSGFLANLGVISALARQGDAIFFDRLDHASLIDGVLASGALWKRFS
ncbi:MAG: aminotransferase class I/II-fold pyridoxal phosphate-dependent enzyme, partial [Candidatus Goldiibacteriota bacterium]